MKKRLQILMGVALLTACTNNKVKPRTDPNDKSVRSVDSSDTINEQKELLVKRGSYEDARFKVIAYSRFIIPEKLSYDSSFYFKENILSLTDKNTNRTYKIQTTDPCSSSADIIIDNVTNSLEFKSPLFEIATPDCSDWYISEFISFKENTLQKLFEISDARPAKLIKANDYSLTGTVKDRDEIVADFQDYPITVSLNDYSITQTKPDRQEIGFATEAIEEIHGLKLDKAQSTSAYVIRKGTKLVVDSIFRDTQQVRLKLKDSLYIVCPFSEIEGKVQGNNAG